MGSRNGDAGQPEPTQIGDPCALHNPPMSTAPDARRSELMLRGSLGHYDSPLYPSLGIGETCN